MVVAFGILYFAVLFILCTFGLHRAKLVWQCYKYRKVIEAAPSLATEFASDDELPMVTIQLPIFNESTVVVRLLESVAKMDYPLDKLHIQILDDSTDETRNLARKQVARMRRAGFDAEYIHRVDRVGYKAGALENGLLTAKGSLIAIFDADFLPAEGFCRSLVGHFTDPEVAMVQARWAHLNREASLLTRVQALMLDGHHMVENRARYGAGSLFNFSGTGGMWRKEAIDSAGGWQHDTLTEDLDLSYRAQLKGWKFIYRADVVSPAELPEEIGALRAQQHRWAKGTVQTARKLLARVLHASSGLSFGQRVEALFHMTPHFAYPLMVALAVLLLPMLLLLPATDVKTRLLIDLPLCLAPITSLASFYMLAEKAQGRSRWSALRLLPALISLGAGLSTHLTKAVLQGMRQRGGEFVRTPKRGNRQGRYMAVAKLPLAELGMGLVCLTNVVVAVITGHYFVVPFMCFFTAGYGYLAFLVIQELWSSRPERLASSSNAGLLPDRGSKPSIVDAAA